MARRACLAISTLLVAGCRADRDEPAPFSEAADPAPECSTESVFPELLLLVRTGELAPLRDLIESRLVPGPGNPRPEPSLRSLIGAGVTIVRALGLEEVLDAAEAAKRAELLEKLRPLVIPIFRYVAGQVDATPHYEGAEAMARFVDRCNPDHLLAAVAAVIELESRQEPGRLWIDVAIDAIAKLLADPTLVLALDAFERGGATGRPAVVSLVGQIMTFLDDDDFELARVRTLYEDAVEPAVEPALAAQLEGLLDLMEEVTDPNAAVFDALKGAFRCGNQHPEDRDVIVGFLFDLVDARALELEAVLATTTALVSDEEARELFSRLSIVVRAIRVDTKARDELRGLISLLLQRPAIESMTPFGIELLESPVVDELLSSLPVLLEGCGAMP
ncbi:MAG: hypothetical protein HYV07_18015 [Deltaproteobacteria bacterium]|nr:hypothetical protein [Deltaproteobacteria bacterium]